MSTKFAQKRDLFGIESHKVVALLKSCSSPVIVPFVDGSDPVLVKCGFFLYRMWPTDELTAKYPVEERAVACEKTRAYWQRFEAKPGVSLRLTNVVLEVLDGTLARKFVADDGRALYVDMRFLAPFGARLEELRDFVFEAATDEGHEGKLHYAPLCIMKDKGYTVGYISGMCNIHEFCV